MLRPRIIPCLLIKNGGLVKTTKFEKPKYVGDPINAVKIFNEKEVDELIVLDIDATVKNVEPDYLMIKNLAEECRMPLCYGGGVKKLEQIERIISLGVEKVAISSAAVSNPELLTLAAKRVGNQSIVVVVDVNVKEKDRYEIWTHNGRKRTGLQLLDFVKNLEIYGAGEIIVNSIDRDGTMGGYDCELIQAVWDATSLPVTALGGAGTLNDIEDLVNRFDYIGAAAGSLFVFKGQYRAVLISYPNRSEKNALIGKYGR